MRVGGLRHLLSAPSMAREPTGDCRTEEHLESSRHGLPQGTCAAVTGFPVTSLLPPLTHPREAGTYTELAALVRDLWRSQSMESQFLVTAPRSQGRSELLRHDQSSWA